MAAAFHPDGPQEPVQLVERGVAPDAQLHPVGMFPGPDRQVCRLQGGPPPVPPARVWGGFEAGPGLDAMEQVPADPVAGHCLAADAAGPRDCGAHGLLPSRDDRALGASPAREGIPGSGVSAECRYRALRQRSAERRGSPIHRYRVFGTCRLGTRGLGEDPRLHLLRR